MMMMMMMMMMIIIIIIIIIIMVEVANQHITNTLHCDALSETRKPLLFLDSLDHQLESC